jgi:transformation/transcription domain-associated protein
MPVPCFFFSNFSPFLFISFQILLSEIGSRFVTLPEERLLAVVNALLHRCYKYPTATTGEVPQSLRKELSGVCRACFSAEAVNKHVDFVREYKQDFERDLDPESTATFPPTLSELTERLKRWKNILQSNVEDRLVNLILLELMSEFNIESLYHKAKSSVHNANCACHIINR